jgi:hypothetical protein
MRILTKTMKRGLMKKEKAQMLLLKSLCMSVKSRRPKLRRMWTRRVTVTLYRW